MMVVHLSTVQGNVFNYIFFIRLDTDRLDRDIEVHNSTILKWYKEMLKMQKMKIKIFKNAIQAMLEL